MHCQPGLFLSLQLLPILHMETSTLMPPEAPKTRLKTAALSPFNFICGSVAKSWPTLCNPMDCNTPGFPVHHQLPELIQTHVHQIGDAIQPSHPLSSPSPSAFNLFQHEGLFQQDGPSHEVAKVLEFQLQHQSFQ